MSEEPLCWSIWLNTERYCNQFTAFTVKSINTTLSFSSLTMYAFFVSSSLLCLSLSQVGDPLAEWTSSSISGALHKLTLAKLQPDSLYEVEMTAKNCAGLGQPAMMTFRTGKGKTLSC